MRHAHLATLPLLALLLGVTGCEEEKRAPSPAKSVTAAPAVAPPVAPEPTKTAAAPRPKKKLEDCPKGPNVTIENSEVEAQIRLKAQKEKGDITQADLSRVKSLNISQADLPEIDICLFSHMKNLKELFLGKGDYDDLSPLANATQLESLRASINQVKDLSPLAEMKKLDRLDLGRTQVSDLSPLANLTLLTELQLDDTPVEDLKPLAKLEKLQRLSLKRTKVKDASPLAGLKALKFLYIGGSPLEEDQSTVAKVRGNGTKVIID
jgi:internalin A